MDNDVASESSRIINEFTNKVTNNPVSGRIGERMFFDNFLPYFGGKLNIADAPNVLSDWFTISGGVVNPVDVYDDDTEEVLFRVPGLMSSDIISYDSTSSGTLASLINGHSMRRDFPPGYADSFFLNGLANEFSDVFTTPDDSEATRLWDIIFKRYNVTVPDAVSASKSNDEDDDFLSYEE